MLEVASQCTTGTGGRRSWIRTAGVLLAIGVGACVPTPHGPEAKVDHGRWGEALAAIPGVRWEAAAAERTADPWTAAKGVVLVDDNWRLPAAGLPGSTRKELVKFVRGGGRLVLFGHAAHLVAELGIDENRPERTVFRWGFDPRAVAGVARLGMHIVSGDADALFAGIDPVVGTDSSYHFAGGTPCTAPVCAWSIGLPRSGKVLARLLAQRDGADDSPGAPVLVQWSVGAGAVLACGLVPRLDHETEAVRVAARTFVQRCADWACSGGALVVLTTADRTPVPASVAALPPLAPLVPHWGWQMPHEGDGDERAVEELVADVVSPAWLAGADLCEIDLVGRDGAVPIPWSSADPLRPAPSFESRPDSRLWQRSTFAALAQEAHARGMLVNGALEPLPVGGRASERLATLRFLARELACVRRLGEGAFDGFRVRRWQPDTAGYALAMLQDFAPAAALWRFGERVPEIAGALHGLDADDGVLASAPLAGVTASWRDGFAADLFPHGVLAAEVRVGARTEPRPGGCYGDWIVEQANDFARARAGTGAAMWWRRHDPGALDRDTIAYVHGVSLEPLRAAVAMPLTATGADGVRAAAAKLVAGAPATFAGSAGSNPSPAAVHVLQNNWFRLSGSGGRLEIDPTGQARFGSGATVLATSCMRTRLFGGRPDTGSLRSERTDCLANGQRGEGGYAAVAHVGSDAGDDAMPPAVLQCGAAPAWPASAVIEWRATVGYHELDLLPRGVQGKGVLTVALDGVVLSALAFDNNTAAQAVTIPLHVAREGRRRLEFTVLFGGGMALDRAVVRRIGDVGVEASVVTAAGSRAAVRESSQSSYHAEQLELTTLADLPGFVVSARCDRAVRNLQVERTFAWLAQRQLLAGANAAPADGLSQAFVLASTDASRPDVVVVPMQFARYETLRYGADTGLVWHLAPQGGMQSRVGMLFCAAGTGRAWLAHAATVLGSVVALLPLDLGAGGEASVVSDLPVAWTRLVQIEGDIATPFLVRENGLWQWRGSQPSPDGQRWLRIQHTPGDVVQIVGGPAVLARTRPGPGSLRLLALRDPEPGAVTVQVLQPPRLQPPAVVMAADFDEVRIDGEPWAHFDGRTIWLPSRVGTFLVTTRSHAGTEAPHVRAAKAPFTTCCYVPERRELVLATPGSVDRPAELPWTAVLAGPRPTSIENGEIVDDATLRWPDVEQAALARRGGTLIRFKNGVTRVRYGD
jgi:hypothetical protein